MPSLTATQVAMERLNNNLASDLLSLQPGKIVAPQSMSFPTLKEKHEAKRQMAMLSAGMYDYGHPWGSDFDNICRELIPGGLMNQLSLDSRGRVADYIESIKRQGLPFEEARSRAVVMAVQLRDKDRTEQSQATDPSRDVVREMCEERNSKLRGLPGKPPSINSHASDAMGMAMAGLTSGIAGAAIKQRSSTSTGNKKKKIPASFYQELQGRIDTWLGGVAVRA